MMDIPANIECLKNIWDRYEGKWVAIRNGDLLGHADRYKELHDEFKDVEDIVITRLV